MSDTHVWLYNPETRGVWECPVDYESTARARGWVDTDPPGEEEAAEAEVAFDPSEHTVAEVAEHLADHPEDAEQVAEAEQAGKDRVGVADAVEQVSATDDAGEQ
jgi:hypothetical protein